MTDIKCVQNVISRRWPFALKSERDGLWLSSPRKRCSQNLLTLWSVVSILKDRSPATSSLFRIFLVCFSAFCRMDARYVFAWISTCNFFCLTCGCAFFFSVWKHFVWLELSSFLSFIFDYFREFRMHKNNDLTSTHREQKGGLNFQETAKNGKKLYKFKRNPIFCNHFWQFDFKINDELTFFVDGNGFKKMGLQTYHVVFAHQIIVFPSSPCTHALAKHPFSIQLNKWKITAKNKTEEVS